MGRAHVTKDGLFWRRRDERTGGISRFWWTNLGGRRTSTGCTSLEDARIWRREREREAVDPAVASSRATALSVAIDRFLAELRGANRASRTLDYYTQKLRVWLTFFGTGATLSRITPAAVTDFVAWRTTDQPLPDGSVAVGASHRTAKKEIESLLTMLRSAKHRGEYVGDVDALKPLRLDAPYVPRERFPTRDQFAALVAELEARRLHHRAAWIAAAVATGGRAGEIHRLRREHVDAKTGRYTLLVSKTIRTEGGKRSHGYAERVRITTPEGRRWLVYALKHGKGEAGHVVQEWAPPNMVQCLARVGTAIGVPAYSANDFRRALASWLRQDGVPPDLIAFVLGHSSSAMAERVYARMTAETAASLIQGTRTKTVRTRTETGRRRPKAGA